MLHMHAWRGTACKQAWLRGRGVAQIPLHLVQWAAMFETPDSLDIDEADDIAECSPLTRGMWTQMANLTVKSIQTT